CPARAYRLTGATSTVLRGKLYLDHMVMAFVYRRTPTAALATFWARHPLLLPINVEVTGGEALTCAGLPVIIRSRRSDQVHSVASLTFDKEFRIDIAGVR